MLAIQNKQLNSIFERVIRDNNGVLVIVRFTIVEINGKLQGQIISVTPFVNKESSESKDGVICLPKVLSEKKVFESNIVYRNIISPFNSLFFFNSQPTRAPSI